VCHFRTFRQSMEAPQHIVDSRADRGGAGGPDDDRSRAEHPAYRSIVEKFVRGDPDAILLVEFVGDDRDAPAEKLDGSPR